MIDCNVPSHSKHHYVEKEFFSPAFDQVRLSRGKVDPEVSLFSEWRASRPEGHVCPHKVHAPPVQYNDLREVSRCGKQRSGKHDETAAMPCFPNMINDKKVSVCQGRTAQHARGGQRGGGGDLAQSHAVQPRQERLTCSVPHKKITRGLSFVKIPRSLSIPVRLVPF